MQVKERNIAVFYDTETTGMPDWGAPSDAQQQPHIVQLAAHQVDLDERKILQSMDVIVCPEGWEITDEATETHGITTEYAKAVGVPESLALEMFMALYAGNHRIAHNESFDARIVRIALKRFMDDATADEWKAGTASCTARMATKICDLPPTEKMKAANRHHAKTPNLSEAYQFFTGLELQDAHTAIADVNACMDVYWGIQAHLERMEQAATA